MVYSIIAMQNVSVSLVSREELKTLSQESKIIKVIVSLACPFDVRLETNMQTL